MKCIGMRSTLSPKGERGWSFDIFRYWQESERGRKSGGGSSQVGAARLRGTEETEGLVLIAA
jgi:hypothetical protein